MKNTVKRFLALALALIMTLSLVACGSSGGGKGITLTDPGQVSLMNEGIAEYMADDASRVTRYATGQDELSHPKAAVLTWNGGTAPYTVKVGEKQDLSDAWTFTADAATVEVINLKVGTTYYWSVTDSASVASETGSFTTAADAPRTIKCPGVANMRDLGGWKTEDGKTVNQGLIYRCGRLNVNSAEVVTPEILDIGLEVMDQLGIKTELDLRESFNNEIGSLTESLIDGAQYVNIPMIGELNKTRSLNDAEILQIFELLADESNYPFIIHCSIGTDRTGYVSYLINALLGVPYESLERDYLLSNFGKIGGSRNIARIENDYIKYINGFDGATLADKTENYLLGLGVTQQQIDAVRSIMLG